MIREARESDVNQLFELAGKLATSFVVEEKFRAVFDSMLELEHICIYVMEQEDRIIGYLLGGCRPCFYASGNVGWVEEVFVDVEFRGQSMGRELMGYFEDWSQRKGCRLVSLATRRAAPFYLALGYEDSATYFKKNLNDAN